MHSTAILREEFNQVFKIIKTKKAPSVDEKTSELIFKTLANIFKLNY